MRAVVLEAPYTVTVKDVPKPEITDDSEVVIRVSQSGLCGSDLHWYRGHAKYDEEFILGHEVVGEITSVGKGVRHFIVGDVVVAPFSTSCGACFYCIKGYTSRCAYVKGIGTPALPGAQAEYVKIPLADTTLLKAPTDIRPELLVLMADIIPTGFMTAQNARKALDSDRWLGQGARMENEGVCVVIGCGPVGLCAITSALTMFQGVFATDIAAHRLTSAKKHGAHAMPLDELRIAVLAATNGRGADAVLEVVGHASALQTAVELVRPLGVISSCGVHTRPLELPGSELYGKNIRFQFGRCSVRTVFQESLEILLNNQDLFGEFIEHKIGIERASEYYELFEKNQIAKTVLVFE